MSALSFTSAQVCNIMGITYRQLDYWDRSGFIRPSVRQANGSGTRRLYGFKDLVQIKVAKRLLAAGIPLARVRKGLKYLSKNLPSFEAPLAELMFVTNGKRMYIGTENPDIVVDLAKEGQLVWNFHITSLAEEVQTEIGRVALSG